MSYRNQYSGSPWQQGGPPFGVGSYNQSYGGYNDQYGVSHQMMNTGYSRSQGGYGSMYGGSGMGQMRNMGYGGPSQSRHYMNDRMGGRSLPRGQMQRKRLPQRSPASGPRSKRPNIETERRLAKPRRRRDSRGGSKGRSHDQSDDEDEDDTYNPEEPTDDLSDVDCDVFEIWKSSDEDGESKGVEKETGAKENGEQETNEDAEGADKDSKSVDEATPKKPLICYVCKVTCTTRERLTKHQAGKTHTSKIEALLAIRREKKKDFTDDEKKDKGSPDQDRKKLRKPGNWCTVCECAFSGNFLAHRRTKEHRKKRDKKYPKCRPCRLGFSSSEEYRDHYKSEDHKQRSAEFHYLKNLASGSDDDEAAIEPVKVEEDKNEEAEKMEEETNEDATKTEEDSSGVENQEKNDEKTEDKDTEKKDEKKSDGDVKQEAKKPKLKEPKAVGQSFVVSVQGYYCKLCHKFFKDVTVAKSKHARSIMHTEAFKKAMEEAVEQEEDRQKLAEEQDKIDREAADAADLASEIAAIERSAKEAAKREVAEKKAGIQKDQDVEMKDVSDETPKKDDSPPVKEEKMDSTEEKKVENGVKDEPQSETPVVAKSVKEPVPEEKPKDAKEEKPEDEAEEETEEIKEEVTSSPATRRGRGRGRGRKRR